MPAGDYLVDVRTGETTPLPESITTLTTGNGRGTPNDLGSQRSIHVAGPGARYRVSPDGRHLPFEGIEQELSTPLYPDTSHAVNPRTHQLYVASIDGSTVRRVTAESRGAVFGDWSPDGSTIVYVAGWGFAATDGHAKRKADLVVIDMMTGAVEELGTLENVVRGRPLSPVPLPRFTPDGQAIVYTELRERRLVLRFVPAVGGERERLRRGAAWAAYSPHAVPSNHDPRWFGRQLLVAGADLGAVTEFALGSVRNLQNPIWSPDGTHLAFSTGTTAYVADLETGVSKAIALGYADDWLDDHTLIVEVR